jgi:hypothetical protein
VELAIFIVTLHTMQVRRSISGLLSSFALFTSLQPDLDCLSRQPFCSKAFVVCMEFWLGLAVRYRCLDESGWRARRSSSSATCCSADRFGLIICFFPSAPGRPAGGSSVILPLQKHPYHENQGTNNPEEGLGILGPLPVLHFAFAFSPSCISLRCETRTPPQPGGS